MKDCLDGERIVWGLGLVEKGNVIVFNVNFSDLLNVFIIVLFEVLYILFFIYEFINGFYRYIFKNNI